MFATEAVPSLQLIKGVKPGETMKKIVFTGFDVGQFAQENRAKLGQLEQRRELLTIFSYAAWAGGIAGLVMFSPSAALTLPPLGMLLGELQGASQRFLVMQELVEAFEGEDVAIEVGLKPEGLREIDFFLRFPDKEFILIQIRSVGEAKVVYNEKLEALQFRRKGGGLTTWKPDPLAELTRQEQWLRKERHDLLGTSSRDKRRPLSKLLVLANETTVGEHSEALHFTENSLTVRRSGTFSVVSKDQVVNFVRAYLSLRRSPS
jgi:hypothetical protein